MIIGLDMGGTHIDGVVIKNNKVIRTIKRPTDRADLFACIWMTLKESLKDLDKSKIKRINLSTTISTNAIVEDNISKVGMVIQSGPGLKNDFLACGHENNFISGYMDHRGVLVETYTDKELLDAKKLFQEKDIQAIAIVGKFSTRNPKSELDMYQMFKDEFKTITLGHRMSGILNFPRRVYTSYLNSAVSTIFNEFVSNIHKALEEEGIDCDLSILKADGGTMSIESALKKPVETILSGPASSFMGMSAMIDSNEDMILLDIGGTTTDIFFLVDRQPLFKPLGARISKYNTLVRAVYSDSIGIGGDSEISVKENQLFIGPKRQGRAYCLEGPSPTPTDAMVYLGLMELPEGASYKRAQAAMKSLSKKLNKPLKDTSQYIIDQMALMIKSKTDFLLKEINSRPIYTIKELLHGKKLSPLSIHLIGGPAKVLAPIIEKTYNLKVYCPENYAVANAIGAAIAKPTYEITLLADTYRGKLTVPELGINENIDKYYTLDDAKERAIDLLKEFALNNNLEDKFLQAEITEANLYNMVRGFHTVGKNIRIKAQIKPGFLFNLKGEDYESKK